MSKRAKKPAIVLLQVVLGLFCATHGHPSVGDDMESLRREVDALKEGQSAIRKDLEELRALIKGTAPGSNAGDVQNLKLAVAGSPFLGKKDAALTLIEFYDYECPFCARHVQQTLPQIERDYVETGKLKYVVRDFPIESIHPESFKKHEAARCAGEQGEFWKMRTLLLGSQKSAGSSDLSNDAKTLGLNVANFQKCLEAGQNAPAIRTDLADGGDAGVTGSPTFFLGTTAQNGARMQVLRIIRGAQPYQVFKDAIEAALRTSPGKN